MSLGLALLGLCLPVLLRTLHTPRVVGWMALWPAVVTFVVVMAGLICAVVALCSPARNGKRPVFRAGLGVAVNLLLLTVMIAGFFRGRANQASTAQKIQRIQESARRLTEDARRAVDEGAPLSTNAVNDLRQQLTNVAAQLPRQAGRTVNSFAAVLANLQPLLKAYDDAVQHLDNNSPFDVATITNKSVLAIRRDAVIRYRTASERFRKFYVQIGDDLRAELRRQGAPESSIELSVQSFEGSMGGRKEIVIAMRDQDLARAKVLLEFCDLLESRWGTWRYNRSDNTLDFESQDDAERYANLIAQEQAALDKQTALQKQFFGSPKAP